MRKIEDDIVAFQASGIERISLEEKFVEGSLESQKEIVLEFVKAQRRVILGHAMSLEKSHELDVLKAYIITSQSLCIKREIEDQLQEISREIWYAGERGLQDRLAIQSEWIKTHASNWRAWRIKEYLFIVDKLAVELSSELGSAH